jgi:hypothetical protein
MFEGEQQQVQILKKETVDKTTVVLFKHMDKELYAVRLESFLNRNPDGLFEECWENTSSVKLIGEVSRSALKNQSM